MRYRDLETGTFLTRDPLGFVDGPNVYTYVNQNPWTKFDPHGLRKTKAGVTPRDYDHHIVPVELWDDYGFGKEAQQVFDQAQVETPNGHNYTAHGRRTGYTRHVEGELQSSLQKYMKDNNITEFSAKHQKEFAEQFVEQIKNTDNKYIKGFNKVARFGPEKVREWNSKFGSAMPKPKILPLKKMSVPKMGVGTKGAKKIPIVKYLVASTVFSVTYAEAQAEGNGPLTSGFVATVETLNPLPVGSGDMQAMTGAVSDFQDDLANEGRNSRYEQNVDPEAPAWVKEQMAEVYGSE